MCFQNVFLSFTKMTQVIFFIFFMVCKSQNNFTQNFLDTYMLVIRKKELLFVKSYGAHCSLQNRDVNKLTNIRWKNELLFIGWRFFIFFSCVASFAILKTIFIKAFFKITSSMKLYSKTNIMFSKAPKIFPNEIFFTSVLSKI